jgi:hypothetical protein
MPLHRTSSDLKENTIDQAANQGKLKDFNLNGSPKTVMNSHTKKNKGKQRINMEYIKSKERRQITFYKRKRGLIKKAHELSILTGSELLLLIASETGHIYTYATDCLQPIIMEEENKSFIHQCIAVNTTKHQSPNSDRILSSKIHNILPDRACTLDNLHGSSNRISNQNLSQENMRPFPPFHKSNGLFDLLNHQN